MEFNMRIHGTSNKIYKPVFTYLKKHYCPQCGHRLKVITVSKVVNSDSTEAYKYDWSYGDLFLEGNVEFICPKCNFQISIDRLYAYEKNLKKGHKNDY